MEKHLKLLLCGLAVITICIVAGVIFFYWRGKADPPADPKETPKEIIEKEIKFQLPEACEIIRFAPTQQTKVRAKISVPQNEAVNIKKQLDGVFGGPYDQLDIIDPFNNFWWDLGDHTIDALYIANWHNKGITKTGIDTWAILTEEEEGIVWLYLVTIYPLPYP